MFFLLTASVSLGIMHYRERQSRAVVATLFEPGLLENPGRAPTVGYARFLRQRNHAARTTEEIMKTFKVTLPDGRQSTFNDYEAARQWATSEGFEWDACTLTITDEE